jgi:hypothetical protein
MSSRRPRRTSGITGLGSLLNPGSVEHAASSTAIIGRNVNGTKRAIEEGKKEIREEGCK